MKSNLEDILNEYADSRAAAEPAKPMTKPAAAEKAADKPAQKPKKAAKHVPEAVKWAALFGGLFALVCFWHYTDQMALTAALPSMCVCAALGGYGVGKGNRK